MKITIYGTGCANCKELERRARAAMESLGQEAEFEKVENMQQIIAAGVLRTPGLAVNDEMRMMGQVPPQERLATMFADVLAAEA